ncbi:MAG TPA: SMC-Scp complex subunit ScpB [Candidatus Paceibacterota bacterium]|nr:SMC-Scp complex subunit ScpB [Candidatus Paceibacterota bacterium]
MNEQQLKEHIEALLFVEGAMQKKELAKLLGVSSDEIGAASAALSASLAGHGISLVDDGQTLELRTAPSVSSKIEELRREELSRDIGRAGLEVLSAILYRGPLTRAEVDFIRGVNSSQTLRTLLMRGLVRKVPNPKDERSFLYEPTTDLLGQLGIMSMGELPEFEEVRAKLSQLEEAYRNKEASASEQTA